MIQCKFHNLYVTDDVGWRSQRGASASKHTKWPTGNQGHKI